MRRSVEDELSTLPSMTTAQLRERWSSLTSAPVPRVSAALLRLALACELQVRVHGGLSRRASRRLAQLSAAKSRTTEAQAGMRLVREWNGVVHIVTVGDNGIVSWNDREWRSLSEVARAITGTRWSGPAFFGLRRKVAA